MSELIDKVKELASRILSLHQHVELFELFDSRVFSFGEELHEVHWNRNFLSEERQSFCVIL